MAFQAHQLLSEDKEADAFHLSLLTKAKNYSIILFATSTGHIGVAQWRQVMGIRWMRREELAEAIPPAYTEVTGRYLMQAVRAASLAGRVRPRRCHKGTR